MRTLQTLARHSTVRILHLQSICTSAPLVIRFLGGGFLERKILCRGEMKGFVGVQYFAMSVVVINTLLYVGMYIYVFIFDESLDQHLRTETG